MSCRRLWAETGADPARAVASFAELDAKLLEHCPRRLGDRLRSHDETIGEWLVRDRAAFLPLPATPVRGGNRKHHYKADSA
jgi:hypothetical protein